MVNKGNRWLISPDHKALFLRGGYVRVEYKMRPELLVMSQQGQLASGTVDGRNPAPSVLYEIL